MRNIVLIILSITLLGCASKGDTHRVKLTYYPNGMMKSSTATYKGKLDGIKRIFREDGSLATAIKYKNGKINGFKNAYYPDGSAWRVELYNNNKLVEISEYDEQGIMIFEEQNY